MDFVIDGVGGLYIGQGFCALKAGGKLAEYAYPNFKGMLAGLLKLKLLHLFSNGKYGEFYGISTGYKKDKTNIQEDMESLFHLLKDGKINPIISERFPILEAAKANSMLESGKISGKIVLASPDHGCISLLSPPARNHEPNEIRFVIPAKHVRFIRPCSETGIISKSS